MATVRQKELFEQLGREVSQTRKASEKMIVSNVSKIRAVNPLAFFVAGETGYRGQRTYWSDPTKNVVFISIGAAHTINATGLNRFQDVERQWNNLRQNCIIDPPQTVPGTGPLLLGGFSFDPLAMKTAPWRNFSDATFNLPKFLLTVTQSGDCWLTVNFVRRLNAPGDEMYQLKKESERLLERAYEIERTGVYEFPPAIRYSFHEVDPVRWKHSVNDVARDIREGKMEKLVLARELHVTGNGTIPISSLLYRLNKQQPDSFVFAYERGDTCFIGASPERLIRKEGIRFFTASVAGSIRRGKTEHEDKKLGDWLLQDVKNLHEHQVVVKAITQSMQSGCVHVDVPSKPSLYKVRDIQHLYTPIVGQARQGETLLSMVEKLHPTPALGGFPRDVALREIRKREPMDRGWYASPVGWLDVNGNGEFAVAIRSGLINGRQATLFAGCGVMGDSDPDSEYEETMIKFQPMISALGGPAYGRTAT